ncbi:MAG: M48 family metalloprotease [Rhodospirillales bacterium]|nr:M48 family metalloprotease [Rhodospirillales bacterium]MCB9972981.1 M48 family metalloprotease [Rhodospirillales bacterium]MCB9980031.1 M48 family metalloprotease [Rhodospirillales bacterium]
MRVTVLFLCLSVLFLSACATNPATGRNQFTGLMPPGQEASIGASEHQKVLEQFGLVQDQDLQTYVTQVGRNIVPYTERGDVTYKFFVLDSDTVNAFALPGGYVYVTRGLLSLANSEAELAAVIAHEIGHVTGRHSAERYSRGVVTAIGAAVLGASIDNPNVTKALNTGTDLYLRSYSRSQESEADQLGVRYLYRAGYDPFAMSRFLQSLQQETALQSQISGRSNPPAFLSTHPDTGDRSAVSAQIAGTYEFNPKAVVRRDDYLRQINGLIYGNAHKEGFTQGQTFFHPKIGFKFTAPRGFDIINQSDVVIAKAADGTAMIFDFDSNQQAFDPQSYLQGSWMNNEQIGPVERVMIGNMRAAMAQFPAMVKGRAFNIRLVSIEWQPHVYARFQIAMPQGLSSEQISSLREALFSFSRMTDAEKGAIKLEKIAIVTARPGDTVASLAARQPFEKMNEARFRVLNALALNEGLQAGRLYKIVVR